MVVFRVVVVTLTQPNFSCVGMTKQVSSKPLYSYMLGSSELTRPLFTPPSTPARMALEAEAYSDEALLVALLTLAKIWDRNPDRPRST